MKVEYKRARKNRPIATVIKEFAKKDSGKVSAARRDIVRRFVGLDWKDQKRILHLFLESNATDRRWAYGRLVDLWDDSFEERVVQLWKETKETGSSWPIIRNFPTKFLLDNINEFTGERDYYYICRRFIAEVPDFVIDSSRLSPLDYLDVMRFSDKKITAEDAMMSLLKIVLQKCIEPLDEVYHYTIYTNDGSYEARVAFDELQRGIRYVEDLGFHDVAYDFDKWNESNTSDMHRSVYQTMSTIDEDIPAYKQIRIREFLARSYFFNLLAPDYFPDESVVPEIRSRLQMPWLEITKMREERDDVPF